MIVQMYMTRDLITVTAETPMSRAIHIMMQNKIRRLVVADKDQVQGMVCQRDIFNHFPHDVNPFSAGGVDALKKDLKIWQIMTENPMVVDSRDPIEIAAKKMANHHIGGLPVVRSGRLVGIITESDVFRALASILSPEKDSVRVTFDPDDETDTLLQIYELGRKFELNLLSFLTYEFNGRTRAVANLESDTEEKIQRFVNALWHDGHMVENVLRTKALPDQ